MKDLTQQVTDKLIDKLRTDKVTEADYSELIESLEYMLELHHDKMARKLKP